MTSWVLTFTLGWLQVLSYRVTRTVVCHKCVYCVYWSKISIQPMYVCLCRHLNHYVRPHNATLWNWPPCFYPWNAHSSHLSLKGKMSCSTIYGTCLCIWEGPLCHKLILRVSIGWKSNVLCISASLHFRDYGFPASWANIVNYDIFKINYLLSLCQKEHTYQRLGL